MTTAIIGVANIGGTLAGELAAGKTDAAWKLAAAIGGHATGASMAGASA